jgi:hypothetical protein
MTEKQATIFGTNEPVATHRDDVVECSDGSNCSRKEAFADCRGEYHCTEQERRDADVLIVEDVLDGVVKWAEGYCTENSDYADGYFCCVSETSHEWSGPIEEWVEYGAEDILGHVDLADTDGLVDSVVSYISENLDAGFDCEPEYNHTDYSNYSGDGCCLWGFKIEEHEEQVDISCFDELKDLHDQRRLDDVLDGVNCDAYVNRNRRREKNEETGYYENVGRKTYMPYDRDDENPTFEVCFTIRGGWDFVVSAERMTELVGNALLDYHGYADYIE